MKTTSNWIGAYKAHNMWYPCSWNPDGSYINKETHKGIDLIL